MNSLNYVKQNITEISSYALLDWLESHFKVEIEDNDRLVFKGAVALSIPSSDLNSIENNEDRLEIIFNNVGIMGVQGGMSLYVVEEVLQRIQSGDTVLRDFADIFNHRIVELMYKLRKASHLHYYSHENSSTILTQFIDTFSWLDSTFNRSKYTNSPSGIVGLVRSAFGSDVMTNIKKTQSRLVKISNPVHLRNQIQGREMSRLHKLGRSILGKQCIVNDLTRVTLNCLTWQSFESLAYKDDLQKLISGAAVYNKVMFTASLCKDQFQKTKLGFARLGLGIML